MYSPSSSYSGSDRLYTFSSPDASPRTDFTAVSSGSDHSRSSHGSRGHSSKSSSSKSHRNKIYLNVNGTHVADIETGPRQHRRHHSGGSGSGPSSSSRRHSRKPSIVVTTEEPRPSPPRRSPTHGPAAEPDMIYIEDATHSRPLVYDNRGRQRRRHGSQERAYSRSRSRPAQPERFMSWSGDEADEKPIIRKSSMKSRSRSRPRPRSVSFAEHNEVIPIEARINLQNEEIANRPAQINHSPPRESYRRPVVMASTVDTDAEQMDRLRARHEPKPRRRRQSIVVPLVTAPPMQTAPPLYGYAPPYYA